MKIVEKSDATSSLAEYTADIEKEPVIVTSDGIPIAAMVPIGNLVLLCHSADGFNRAAFCFR
jgi:antitoxin (DNA-binding transcriptional repressor) of toxin-antitoxin stability system